jgi:UPF0755 protein
MTDGSGDWTYRGRFGADDLGADDQRSDDDFYPGAGRPGYGPEDMTRGRSGEYERPGYGRPERPGDPYYQPRPGDSGSYGQPGGYDAEPGGFGDAGGYGRSSGYGDDGGYGSSGGYGRYDNDPRGYGGGSPYPDTHQRGDTYGQAGYDHSGSFDRYGRDTYGENPYGDQDSYQPDPDRTSAYGWPQRSGADSSSRPALPAGSSDGYGSNGSLGDTGSFGRADTGSFSNTGSFGRADTGSFSNTGSFGRADTGSFGRDEFGRDDTGHDQAYPSARGTVPAGSDGYAQWHSDPTEAPGWDDGGDHEDAGDEDWADDDLDDDGAVSRLFGRGGRGGDEYDDDGPRGRGPRGRRPRRMRGRLATVAAILVGALVLGAVADYGYEYVHNYITNRYGDYSGAGYGTVKVDVPAGASLSGLGPLLLKDNVIESLRPYDSAASAAPNASSLQPGVYNLHNHMNAKLAVAALLNPKNRASNKITIIEGWRASAIAAYLAKHSGIAASKFTQIIDHPPASLGLPKWAPAGKSAEGFLFPDTYQLPPHASALAILQMMVQDFNHRTAGLRIQAIAQTKSVTPYQMLVAASLIQAEAGRPSDFGKISRVIWNRIQQHMQLRFDSTVFYAMGTYGTYLKTPKQEHYPSPYNTYTHFGLPPGPIDSPGVAAIQAALHAPPGSELYFITDTRHKPYVTHFTSSYTQFQQWQREFQG